MSSINTDFDYLIIGHGIGGASLAWHLYEAGKTFQIIHDPLAPSSSRVAAGIFNPLTGKKLVKTWLADELFPYAGQFYSRIEERLNTKFVHKSSVLRPFRSIEEQNTYLARSADSSVSSYIGNGKDLEAVSEYVRMEYGALEVVQAGWINLPVLLDKSAAFFSENGWYHEKQFAADELIIHAGYVEWQGLKYGKIVLSQGFAATQNKWFNWLPFSPVKGQILEVYTEEELQPDVINQGIFILPLSGNRCRVGATYSWEPLDWVPTQEATAELEEKLSQLLTIPYTISRPVAGIRPSVKDRRPLIGTHPEYNNVCIFNGLGTKGVTLAPFFANELVQHLEFGKELNPLVNIQRYFSLYFR